MLLATTDCGGTHIIGMVSAKDYPVRLEEMKAEHRRFHKQNKTGMCEFGPATREDIEEHWELIGLIEGNIHAV